jgi:hypothetical protein
MIKDIDPLVPLLAGFVCVGFGYAMLNPNTRALFAQRNTASQLQEAAQLETRATEAMKAIAATRQNCTRVAQVSPTDVYQLPAGTAICGNGVSAILGSDGRPTLIAQEVKP